MIEFARLHIMMPAGLCAVLLAAACLAADKPSDAETLRTMVEADWALQEKRLARSSETPQALHDALERAQRLLASLSPGPSNRAQGPDLAGFKAELASLRLQADAAQSLPTAARITLYLKIRWLCRNAALANPLLAGKRILFLQRHRYINQMLHEYHGYWYDKVPTGGGVFVLEQPGRSLALTDLTRDRPRQGAYTTLALSYDARTAYFAFVDPNARPAEYSSPDWMDFAVLGRPVAGRPVTGWRCFHLFALDIASGRIRQITDGPNDDFDPCPLPDGGLAFMSTRRGGYTRCNNPWEPLPVYTLHRMDPSPGQAEPYGRSVRCLSFHETNEWHPSVLNDGRIVYTRWDYVDRSAANFHGIWTTNPDGTNPMAVFGNYTHRPNACYQPRPIPGSRKIALLAGAHHADVGGSLLVLDPDRISLDAASGQDNLDSVDVITPWIEFPEAPGWPTSYVHSPWPLSEDCFLVSYSHDPLPGMSAKARNDVTTGLYYLDRFGNLELLYRAEGISCMYPIPLAERPRPPVIPSQQLGPAQPDGVFMLSDVGRGMNPLPAGRTVRNLRIFQVLPKTWTHKANRPRIGHANAESARLLLGEVPVEADGSAHFRAPAKAALYFQAVDADGRAVHTMRSVTYLQPGETRGCVGCHEDRAAAPQGGTLAMRRGPSEIQPGPDGTNPFCYTRLIQPILDRHCVRCHDGKSAAEAGAKPRPLLTGEPAKTFTNSYQALRPLLRWYEWGGATIRPLATMPGACGADASRLTQVLQAHAKAGRIHLSDAELRRFYLWLDGNVPFYGVYADDARRAQDKGQAVPPPQIR